MSEYASFLAALVCLLLGLALGKAWERYKLQDGHWLDRRRTKQSPHYIQGLNFLVANQLDLAIDELSRAAGRDTEAVEISIILGNLLREKGQVGRAIQIHQQILQRPRLTPLEHTYALLCLGLDFKRGGFVDRALEAFHGVLALDPANVQALLNLEKLHEDQHQWEDAYRIRRRLADGADQAQSARHRSILAFLENELGRAAVKRGEQEGAESHFNAAIDLDKSTPPAYLNLGDLHLARGRIKAAIEVWERLVAEAPDRAYLVLDRLAAAYPQTGQPDRFPAFCTRLIDANAQDWRARVALAEHLSASGRPREALGHLEDALAVNPHALSIHQAIWRALLTLQLDPAMVTQYVERSRDAIFYRDPHICVRCRYRSTELLWQCPHCHEWNTLVEERITPAKDPEPHEAAL